MPGPISGFLKRVARKTTLGEQAAVIAALLCLMLVAVVTVSAAVVARNQAESNAHADVMALATSMADRLDRRMYERFREVKNLAALEPLEDIWAGDAYAIRTVLDQTRSTLKDYAWIGFATLDGTVKAASGGLLEGVSVKERDWFTRALSGPTVGDVHNAKLLAKLLASETGEVPRFVDVAAPVRDVAGDVVGVLSAHLSWDWASQVRNSVLRALDTGLGTQITILAADGTVLLGPDLGSHPYDADIIKAVHAGGKADFTDRVNTGSFLTSAVQTRGYDDYPGLGWIVVAQRPLLTALQPANDLALTILLAGTLCAIFGIGLVYYLLTRVARPLKQLACEVDLIGRDPTTTTITPRQSSSDVLALSMSIRSLLRRVGSAETAHEAAVRESAEAQLAYVRKTEKLGEDIDALKRLADTDPLTGLLNRRAFGVFATDAMNYFRRHKRDVGILVIDIDRFKRVNDTFGHGVGDEVIRHIANIVEEEARTIDKVARFGGEEFVVLLRETDEGGPAVLAERIRQRIATGVVESATHGAIHVTVSVGGALALADDRDVEDVIQRADRALYRAKTSGRNRTVLAGPEDDISAAA